MLKDWRKYLRRFFIHYFIETFPFASLNSVPPATLIFQKNNYRPEPVCLIGTRFRVCSILHGFSLSLTPVNQQRKQLAVRFYSWVDTFRQRVGVLPNDFRLTINGVNPKFLCCTSQEMLFLKNKCLSATKLALKSLNDISKIVLPITLYTPTP